MATLPALSRQYVYVPLAELNFTLSEADVHQIAFKSDMTEAPDEGDWIEAIKVTSGHDLYTAAIGEALAVLVGPDRNDSVTSEELSTGEYLVWVDVSTSGSDERVVDWAGPLTIVTAPEVA